MQCMVYSTLWINDTIIPYTLSIHDTGWRCEELSRVRCRRNNMVVCRAVSCRMRQPFRPLGRQCCPSAIPRNMGMFPYLSSWTSIARMDGDTHPGKANDFHEAMSDISLESSRSSIGFPSARSSASIDISWASSRSKARQSNNISEYWNTKPLSTYTAPSAFSFFKGSQPPSISNSQTFQSPPIPAKKAQRKNKKLLKPLQIATTIKEEEIVEKKHSIRHISESQQVRLLKNLTDYVRYYAGSINNLYDMDDVERLIENPILIPIDLTQDEKSVEGLLVTLLRQFQLGKIRPLNWFDIITGWKKKSERVMTFEEFGVGINRYCDEKELPPWEEEDLDLLFRYFLRPNETKLSTKPCIRRHDFKLGFKNLSLSHRRKLWLNQQGKILRKIRHFLHVLRTSFRDFSIDYVLVQRQLREKRKNQASRGHPLHHPMTQTHSMRQDGNEDHDDGSVGSNSSSYRGVLRRQSTEKGKRPQQHAHFSNQTEPTLGEPGYLYTAVKLQMSNSSGIMVNNTNKLTLSSNALAKHRFTLPQLEATMSLVLGDFLIFLRTKNRDTVLRDYFQKRNKHDISSASHSKAHKRNLVHDDASSVSSLESASSLLQHNLHSDDISTASLFSTHSNIPFSVTPVDDASENPPPASFSSISSPHKHTHEASPKVISQDSTVSSISSTTLPISFPTYSIRDDLVDDYYYTTDAAAMAPSPQSPSQTSTRPNSNSSVPHSLNSQGSNPRLIRRNSSKVLQRQASRSSLSGAAPQTLVRMNSAQMAAMATAAALGISAPPAQATLVDEQKFIASVSLNAAKQHYNMVHRSHGLVPTRSLFQTTGSGSALLGSDDISVNSTGGNSSNGDTGREHRERARSVLRSSLTTRASLFQQYLQSAKSDARLSASSKETGTISPADFSFGRVVDSKPISTGNEALDTFATGMHLFQQKRLQQDDYRKLNDSFEKRVQFAASKLNSCR